MIRSSNKQRSRPGAEASGPPGVADRFSTAGSFAPHVGENWERNDGPQGYYIDFAHKAPEPTWPPPWLDAPDDLLEVATIQWALGAWERYARGEGEQWLEAAARAGSYLLERQCKEGVHDGAWLYWRPMPHTYRIDPPWASAIAQGEAASLLVRLHAETGDDFFAEGAARALRPMQVPTARGGLLAELEGGLTFFEEYPTRPASLVLNGGIFALWGFGDVATGLGDTSAEEWWRRGVESLLALLDRYDTGYWSRYDLYPHPIANVASGAYQLLHENQLGVLARQTGEAAFARASDRFAAYRASRRGRRRAFLSKAAFRVLVPRNPLLANRTPFTRRAGRRGHEDLVVLCYHGISEEWSSELTVTPGQLEAHVGRMLAKGYSAATFSEAILAPRWRKTFAVTFDDAYASVGRLAQPVLDRLGVPATVFVPTSFQDSREPMSWPGIDQWAGGGHRSELRPLGWEQLRELQAAGWEIGSHTQTHPRLTRLADERLVAELRSSRQDCEDRLAAACPAIAYPYGDFDERVARAATRAGFGAGACLPPAPADATALGWPRVGIYGPDGGLRFRVKVSRAMRWARRSPFRGIIVFVSGLRRARPSS